MDETTEQVTSKPKRTRIFRKRTRFTSFPRPAIAVRGLWEQATDEERKTAHRQCMAILEYWLGKASKREISERLEVPALRVWQMSQQALSGMLAGLLRQPKRRAKVSLPPARPEEDPKLLQGRIRELEKKLAHTEDLVRVLKDLPWIQAVVTTPKEKSDGRRKPERRARRGVQVSRGSKAGGRQKAARGHAARGEAAPGAFALQNATDAVELDEAGREI